MSLALYSYNLIHRLLLQILFCVLIDVADVAHLELFTIKRER